MFFFLPKNRLEHAVRSTETVIKKSKKGVEKGGLVG